MNNRAIAIIAACVLFVAAVRAEAGEYRIIPTLTLTEEYDDNIFLTPDNEVHDYITHVIPEVQLTYRARLWDWDVAYSYDYLYYLRSTVENGGFHTLNLTSLTRVVENFFYIRMTDRYVRTSYSPVQDFTQLSWRVNQTDSNIFTISPYIESRLFTRTTITAGFEYRNVWYKDPAAIDRYENIYYVYMLQDLSTKLKMTESFIYTKSFTSSTNDYNQAMFLVGPRYLYKDKSEAWFRAGRTSFDYENGTRLGMPVWDAGIIHQTPTVVLRFVTARTFIDDAFFVVRREDSYVGSIGRQFERTSYSFSMAVRDYAIGDFRYLESRRYTSTFNFSHFLSTYVQGTYGVDVNRYDEFPQNSPDVTTVVWLTSVRFTYLASTTLSYFAEYRFTDSYSAQIYDRNYENNRITVGLTKVF
jgi:hypothetical protein